MEGVYFYWIAWMSWVYVTFFMQKNNQRIVLAIILLFAISLSPFYITIYSFNINISVLILLLFCYKEVSTNSKFRTLFYFLISTLTISLAYSSFLLFELYDPVWLFLDRKIMLAIVLIYVSLFLLKGLKSRLLGVLIGTIHGDILYGVVLDKVKFQYEIGSPLFLDVLSICMALIFVWSTLEELFHHFDASIQKKQQRRNMAK